MDVLGEPLLQGLRKRMGSEAGGEVMEHATVVIVSLRVGVALDVALYEVHDPYFRNAYLRIEGDFSRQS